MKLAIPWVAVMVSPFIKIELKWIQHVDCGLKNSKNFLFSRKNV